MTTSPRKGVARPFVVVVVDAAATAAADDDVVVVTVVFVVVAAVDDEDEDEDNACGADVAIVKRKVVATRSAAMLPTLMRRGEGRAACFAIVAA